VIENERAKPVVAMSDVFLSLKQMNGCGGHRCDECAGGQLAASFLESLGAIIFDGKSERVWLHGAQHAEPLARSSSLST
jgi:hypothetical protein